MFKNAQKNKFIPLDIVLKGVYADNKMFNIECKFNDDVKTVVSIKSSNNDELSFKVENDLSIDDLLLIVDEKIDELFYKITK